MKRISNTRLDSVPSILTRYKKYVEARETNPKELECNWERKKDKIVRKNDWKSKAQLVQESIPSYSGDGEQSCAKSPNLLNSGDYELPQERGYNTAPPNKKRLKQKPIKAQVPERSDEEEDEINFKDSVEYLGYEVADIAESLLNLEKAVDTIRFNIGDIHKRIQKLLHTSSLKTKNIYPILTELDALLEKFDRGLEYNDLMEEVIPSYNTIMEKVKNIRL